MTSIANSSLVQTALFGRDPNWGRVVQAAGMALAGDDLDLGAGVRYVIVHPDLFDAGRRNDVLADISSSSQFVELGQFDDGLGTAAVFRLR